MQPRVGAGASASGDASLLGCAWGAAGMLRATGFGARGAGGELHVTDRWDRWRRRGVMRPSPRSGGGSRAARGGLGVPGCGRCGRGRATGRRQVVPGRHRRPPAGCAGAASPDDGEAVGGRDRAAGGGERATGVGDRAAGTVDRAAGGDGHGGGGCRSTARCAARAGTYPTETPRPAFLSHRPPRAGTGPDGAPRNQLEWPPETGSGPRKGTGRKLPRPSAQADPPPRMAVSPSRPCTPGHDGSVGPQSQAVLLPWARATPCIGGVVRHCNRTRGLASARDPVLSSLETRSLEV